MRKFSTGGGTDIFVIFVVDFLLFSNNQDNLMRSKLSITPRTMKAQAHRKHSISICWKKMNQKNNKVKEFSLKIQFKYSQRLLNVGVAYLKISMSIKNMQRGKCNELRRVKQRNFPLPKKDVGSFLFFSEILISIFLKASKSERTVDSFRCLSEHGCTFTKGARAFLISFSGMDLVASFHTVSFSILISNLRLNK